MGTKPATRLPWERAFLAALAKGHTIAKSAQAAGITPGTAYGLRRTNARFADEWAEAFAAGGRPTKQATRKTHWKKPFLEALAETSNVSASAARVNIPSATVYRLRREDHGFAAQWRAALLEGYDNLEMEVLGHLRHPDPERRIDIANALRLLAVHRETVGKERAARANVSAAEVRASIERKVAVLRKQVAAERENESA